MDSPQKGGGEAYFLANPISKFALDGLHEKQEQGGNDKEYI